MTLIIAGHHLQKETGYIWINPDEEKIEPSLKANGLFVLSDSAITRPAATKRKTILGGFRKSYEVPIKIWKPYFVGEYFQSYLNTYFETNCFIAFAGNTLTSQHVLNFITEHLGKLRISYTYNNSTTDNPQYCILRHCQKNQLEQRAGQDTWAEDLFCDNDYKNIITPNLITANMISEQILYSINKSLKSATEYKICEKDFNDLYCEFVAGIFCPSTKVHKLYVFRLQREDADYGYRIFVDKTEVRKDEIVVLGMKDKFEPRAKKIFKDSIKTNIPPTDLLFDFLNCAIDEDRKSGYGEIDRPSFLKVFLQGELKKIKYEKK